MCVKHKKTMNQTKPLPRSTRGYDVRCVRAFIYVCVKYYRCMGQSEPHIQHPHMGQFLRGHSTSCDRENNMDL